MLTRRALLAASAAVPTLSTFAAEAATPKDVLVMGKTIDDMIAMDPAQAYEFSDNEFDGNIYRKLVMPDPKTGTSVIGDLAEKFEVSSDGLTFTFHLRGDAKFDSGKPVTAQRRRRLHPKRRRTPKRWPMPRSAWRFRSKPPASMARWRPRAAMTD